MPEAQESIPSALKSRPVSPSIGFQFPSPVLSPLVVTHIPNPMPDSQSLPSKEPQELLQPSPKPSLVQQSQQPSVADHEEQQRIATGDLVHQHVSDLNVQPKETTGLFSQYKGCFLKSAQLM
jgi:hypothetical protein